MSGRLIKGLRASQSRAGGTPRRSTWLSGDLLERNGQ